jgi:hypothetical protein
LQTPEFSPLNDLEEKLVAASRGDAAAIRVFEAAVLEATLFAATPEAPSEERFARVRVGEKVEFLTVDLEDGKRATALFAAKERIESVFGECGYFSMKGRDMLELIRANPAILNPGQPYGVAWEASGISALLGLPHEWMIEEPTDVVHLGFPAEAPAELLRRLRLILSDHVEVEAAWLALAFWPKIESYSWYLDIRTDDPRRLFRTAIHEAASTADLVCPLDTIVKPTGEAAGIGLVVVEPRSPVLTRSAL